MYLKSSESAEEAAVTQWYKRVRRVKIKVFKKVLFDNVSTLIGYFGPVNTIYC